MYLIRHILGSNFTLVIDNPGKGKGERTETGKPGRQGGRRHCGVWLGSNGSEREEREGDDAPQAISSTEGEGGGDQDGKSSETHLYVTVV